MQEERVGKKEKIKYANDIKTNGHSLMLDWNLQRCHFEPPKKGCYLKWRIFFVDIFCMPSWFKKPSYERLPLFTSEERKGNLPSFSPLRSPLFPIVLCIHFQETIFIRVNLPPKWINKGFLCQQEGQVSRYNLPLERAIPTKHRLRKLPVAIPHLESFREQLKNRWPKIKLIFFFFSFFEREREISVFGDKKNQIS